MIRARRARRRVPLTPMIDVVFLLLFFFMLAARFGTETGLTLRAGGGGADWTGPPRLVEIGPDAVRLNAVAVAEDGLVGRLAPLMQGPGDAVVLRPVEGADLQRLVSVAEALSAGGLTSLRVVP